MLNNPRSPFLNKRGLAECGDIRNPSYLLVLIINWSMKTMVFKLLDIIFKPHPNLKTKIFPTLPTKALAYISWWQNYPQNKGNTANDANTAGSNNVTENVANLNVRGIWNFSDRVERIVSDSYVRWGWCGCGRCQWRTRRKWWKCFLSPDYASRY
jgi:hypothetical protein